MKKILVFLMIMLLTACSASTSKPKEGIAPKPGKFTTLSIQTELTNPAEKDAFYHVYLLAPGVKKTEPGKATTGGMKIGPFATDTLGKVNFNLKDSFDLNWFLKGIEGDVKKLEVYVVTEKDNYLRNPLNKMTTVEFVENKDEKTRDDYRYTTPFETLKISITDKYPDGVLSLAFPDATFVIRLAFADGLVPKKAYEVSIHKPSKTIADGIGMIRLGRIAGKSEEMGTPFFKTDKLQEWSGTIVVTDFETNARIMYQGYPKRITFDANGKCTEADIITITLTK